MTSRQTALRDDELSAEDAREVLGCQAEVLEHIAGAAPLGDVLGEILSALERLIPGASCSVLLLDRQRATLHHGAAPSLPTSYVQAIDGMAIGDGAGSCGTAAARNEVVVVVDVNVDPLWQDFRDIASSSGLRSCWSTPIAGRDGEPVGTFAVYHRQPHDPNRRESLLVQRFTHLASVAIDHSRAVSDLVESEARFRRSFDDNALGMAILGPDLVIASANAALTRLAGYDPAGRALDHILVPEQGPALWQDDGLVVDDRVPVSFEGSLTRRDKTQLAVQVTVSVLRTTAEQPAQYVVNILDLTERRQAECERQARLAAETAHRTAEELSRAKSALLASLGHEARTPMQAVVGFTELLSTMSLDEDRRREALERIGLAAHHVMDLLSDVLDLSRLEAGALPLATDLVRLAEVVDEAFTLTASNAERRHVTLAHDVGPEQVIGDRRRLLQVLLNLVGNGVRHGNAGGHVTITCSPGPPSGYVEVVVNDDGPGISPEVLPRLFNPFLHSARPSQSEQRSAYDESVGLGMHLAHELTQAMGGELRVGTTSPAGTSLLLRLPAPPLLRER